MSRCRIDHVVVAVPDLDLAMASFRRVGFDVQRGGTHPGRGTANAIVRFGLDYLELLTVIDPNAVNVEPDFRTLAELLAGGWSGYAGFAVATNDIDGVRESLVEAGTPTSPPAAMSRLRPDGSRLRWRALAPHDEKWLRPWPFVIQWDTPDELRLELEPRGDHEISALRLAEISVTTQNAEALLPTYRALGLSEAADSVAGFITVRAGDTAIRLSPGTSTNSSGVEGITLRVANLGQAEEHLRRAGVEVEATRGARPDQLLVSPRSTCGASVVLAQA